MSGGGVSTEARCMDALELMPRSGHSLLAARSLEEPGGYLGSSSP